MVMCNGCGHARMLHQSGTCSLCGASCQAGYTTTVNVAQPVTPTQVGGPSRRGHTHARPQEVSGAANDSRLDERPLGPKNELRVFVGTHLDESELMALTRRLELHDGQTPRNAPWTTRLGDLVHRKLTDETARGYLDELRRRKRNGLPLIRNEQAG